MATGVTFKRAAFDELAGSTYGFALPSGGRAESKIGKGGSITVSEDEAIQVLRADPDWLEQTGKTPSGENPDGTPKGGAS